MEREDRRQEREEGEREASQREVPKIGKWRGCRIKHVLKPTLLTIFSRGSSGGTPQRPIPRIGFVGQERNIKRQREGPESVTEREREREMETERK